MIIFENDGELDIRAAITFGVNVKESENPIGFFGTGLKYALAVLLRTDHQVTICTGLSIYRFALKTETIRGVDFQVVTMRNMAPGMPPVTLGFTTELGPTWEPWMAYRELWCNARDEGGMAYRAVGLEGTATPRAGLTQIVIEGPNIDEVHERRSDFIIDGETPAFKIGAVEIFRGRPRGIFYRGMRVAKQIGEKPMKFTYNILDEIQLTEDRTAKSGWEIEYWIKRAIITSAPEELVSEIICAGDGDGEAKFDFSSSGSTPSAGFLEAVKNCSRSEIGNINASALKIFKNHAARNPQLVPAQLSELQRKMLKDATEFCLAIGFPVAKYPVQVIEGLGDGILGVAQGGRILISAACFERGPQWVRMALIEEFVHLEYSVSDCTREMQTRFLLEIERVGEIATRHEKREAA